MKKMISNLKDPKGVSIVEIMVAILILSTGFLAIAKLQSQALKDIRWAQNRSSAIFLAQSYLESIPYNDLDDADGKEKEITLDKTAFTITTSVNPLGSATQKTVDVEVSWLGNSISLETIRFP